METRVFSKLQQLASPRFRLRSFELLPLEFEEDELLLDEPVASPGAESKVIPIFSGTSPGDLRDRSERHLDPNMEQQQQPRSASDELAEALAELRRSLR